MKKMRWSVVGLIVLVAGCGFLSPQGCARSHGGDTTVELEPGERLEFAAWEETNLVYLTRDLQSGEQPTTHVLHIRKPGPDFMRAQGTVTFKESAK